MTRICAQYGMCTVHVLSRILASGLSHTAAAHSYCLGTATVNTIFRETVTAIWDALSGQWVPPPTVEKWEDNGKHSTIFSHNVCLLSFRVYSGSFSCQSAGFFITRSISFSLWSSVQEEARGIFGIEHQKLRNVRTRVKMKNVNK